MEPIIAVALVLVGYAVGAAKIINEGNEALVERLGRRHRKLSPGLNFIVPFIDQVVMEDTTREQLLDIKPQNVITKDNIYLEVDAVVYWRINDMQKSFYEIDNLQQGLNNLATTNLRQIIAQNTLEQTNVARAEMDQTILEKLNDTSKDWGVQILRVDIQSINPPESVQKSMEMQRAAEIESHAAIEIAEGQRQASVKKAEGTMTSMQIISEAIRSNPESREILRYLVAQDYVEASQKLSASENAKIIFMDPGKSKDIYDQVVADEVVRKDTGKSISSEN
ncbi:Putative stomatin/prohibitin-family membrane protease subunit YbbK [Richelia intracellularis HH01]|uniref:Putative stomatin/prohibitin-family membrane protease subunit YbbK n=1 Tax=Richelia intracellularis HH01 TaxID=1165094 RepID=M1WZI4_9NOST|nr:SPFH domain-containing protein [Richelia intracellularis]CCH66833.1 Putative stomatin/prohibitin-family membrane protease subunit YbbK [Richelia intracellularis HH01]HAE05197.1 SPFH/Band 7/PHB domain protein [Richelia sp.]